jgi:hypothetical protein
VRHPVQCEQVAAQFIPPLRAELVRLIDRRQQPARVEGRPRPLEQWNEDASCGLRDQYRMLYRCDNAESPYHLAEDGPCDLYTPNWTNTPLGAAHVCDTCAERAFDHMEEEGRGMRVRTQSFRKGARKAPVEIISLDQFLVRARKASNRTLTARELLTRLLAQPVPLGENTELMTFETPGGTVVFWVER